MDRGRCRGSGARLVAAKGAERSLREILIGQERNRGSLLTIIVDEPDLVRRLVEAVGKPTGIERFRHRQNLWSLRLRPSGGYDYSEP